MMYPKVNFGEMLQGNSAAISSQKGLSHLQAFVVGDSNPFRIIASSERTQFHNVPMELPPPPGTRNLFIFQHSYSNSTTKNEIH